MQRGVLIYRLSTWEVADAPLAVERFSTGRRRPEHNII